MVQNNDNFEQVHYCGMIESYGALLAINIKTFKISYVSNNISEFLKTTSSKALGKSLEDIFPKAITAVKQLLSSTKDAPYLYKSLKHKKERFYLKVCHANENIIIELEKNIKDEVCKEKLSKKADINSFGLPLNEIQFKVFCQNYVERIKDIIAYDRVMIYKFNADNTGEVISQSNKPNLASYLNKTFTAKHITPIVKRLYMLNSLRHIADVNSDPYHIITHEKESLDLTYSDVRSASQKHVNYLKSIKAKASLSMPIIIDNDLWALLVAHDIKPTYINSIKKQKAIRITKSFENTVKKYLALQKELHINSNIQEEEENIRSNNSNIY